MCTVRCPKPLLLFVSCSNPQGSVLLRPELRIATRQTVLNYAEFLRVSGLGLGSSFWTPVNTLRA